MKTRLALIVVLIVVLSLFAGCSDRLPKKTILAEGGNLLWYNQPCAEYYCGNESRTYYTFTTSQGTVDVGCYDHLVKKVLPSVTVDDYGKVDDHGAPSLGIIKSGDERGKLIIAYSRHDSELYVVKSSEAESIVCFDERVMVDEGKCTYPRIQQIEGDIVIVYRKRIDSEDEMEKRSEALYYVLSKDYGVTWSSPQRILNIDEGKWIFAAPFSQYGNKIAIAFDIYDSESGAIEDIRFLWLDYENGICEDLKGKEFSLPMNPEDASLALKTDESKEVRVWDVKVSEDGIPIITYMLTGGDNTIAYSGRFDFDSKKWIHAKIAEGRICYYPSGIVIDEHDTDRVALAVNRDGITEIEEWKTSDGGYNFNKEISITSKSKTDQFRPQYVQNYCEELRLIWLTSEYYKRWTNFKTDIWGIVR